jgi:hypothetical protein
MSYVLAESLYLMTFFSDQSVILPQNNTLGPPVEPPNKISSVRTGPAVGMPLILLQ